MPQILLNGETFNLSDVRRLSENNHLGQEYGADLGTDIALCFRLHTELLAFYPAPGQRTAQQADLLGMVTNAVNQIADSEEAEEYVDWIMSEINNALPYGYAFEQDEGVYHYGRYDRDGEIIPGDPEWVQVSRQKGAQGIETGF